MLSNALCSFVATFGCSICPRKHFLENAALLFVARYRLFQRFDFLCIVLKGFPVLRSKMSFYARCPANNVLTAEHTHTARSSRETKPKSVVQDSWKDLTSNLSLLQAAIKRDFIS